jgi:hypothetical protein
MSFYYAQVDIGEAKVSSFFIFNANPNIKTNLSRKEKTSSKWFTKLNFDSGSNKAHPTMVIVITNKVHLFYLTNLLSNLSQILLILPKNWKAMNLNPKSGC